MDRRAFLASAAALSGGCLGISTGSSEAEYDVGMSLQAFKPRDITVTAGTRVVWKNTSSRGHTVTAYGGAIPDNAAFFATGDFDSTDQAREAFNTSGGGVIDGGETFAHTFEVPGTYNYFCIPHERGGMVGTVEVTE
jgi:plastocyanin